MRARAVHRRSLSVTPLRKVRSRNGLLAGTISLSAGADQPSIVRSGRCGRQNSTVRVVLEVADLNACSLAAHEYRCSPNAAVNLGRAVREFDHRYVRISSRDDVGIHVKSRWLRRLRIPQISSEISCGRVGTTSRPHGCSGCEFTMHDTVADSAIVSLIGFRHGNVGRTNPSTFRAAEVVRRHHSPPGRCSVFLTRYEDFRRPRITRSAVEITDSPVTSLLSSMSNVMLWGLGS